MRGRVSAWLVGIVAGVASLVPVAAPRAGDTVSEPVYTSTYYRTARGNVGDARRAAGSTTYIGCYSEVDVLAQDIEVGCSAKRSRRAPVSCSLRLSEDEARVRSFLFALNAMSPSAYIEFEWDSSGRCTTLRVASDSRYAPKQ